MKYSGNGDRSQCLKQAADNLYQRDKRGQTCIPPLPVTSYNRPWPDSKQESTYENSSLVSPSSKTHTHNDISLVRVVEMLLKYHSNPFKSENSPFKEVTNASVLFKT